MLLSSHTKLCRHGASSVLAQHLIVLLDPAAIVNTMHDAYGRNNLTVNRYGVFLAGPSATGDIGGVIIHGAQGARSLTVLLRESNT
jgi:L-lactate dehydrogenase complex protein LldG